MRRKGEELRMQAERIESLKRDVPGPGAAFAHDADACIGGEHSFEPPFVALGSFLARVLCTPAPSNESPGAHAEWLQARVCLCIRMGFAAAEADLEWADAELECPEQKWSATLRG